MKKKIQIKDVPYIYTDRTLFEGKLEDIAAAVLNLRNRLNEAYEKRAAAFPNEVFTPFEQYEDIAIVVDHSYDEWDLNIVVFRDETDAEEKAREEADVRRSVSAKLAAANRKAAQEKRERTLLENLKKKYE